MVFILKFVHCGYTKRKLDLDVPQYNSDSPLKYEVSNLNNMRFIDFHVFDPKLVKALELRILKIEDSFSGIRQSIYVLKGCYKWPVTAFPDIMLLP